MAAQLTFTKEPVARALAEWITLASRSLPVPVAPRMARKAQDQSMTHTGPYDAISDTFRIEDWEVALD